MMIELKIKEAVYTYDVYHITKAFFPGSRILQQVSEEHPHLIEVCVDQKVICQMEEADLADFSERRTKKHHVNRTLYAALMGVSGKGLAWGVLTGIRPTKKLMELLEEGKTKEEAAAYYEADYLVSKEKARLGIQIAEKERELLSRLDYEEGYSLYIGIPFCPTTCAYCSFTSYPLAKWHDQVETYLDALMKEITYVGQVSKDKVLNTVYIGGGTPTTLEAEQMDRLLTHLEATFSYKQLKEFTVEAGRPDSITREKLQVLKKHNIDRISINPQSMQQKTLDYVGRAHTVTQVQEAFALAREMGFANINMDLIAGLPGETVEDMEDTLRQIKDLNPDSMTVHALAVKRASKFGQEYREKQEKNLSGQDGEAGTKQLEQMIGMAGRYAQEMHMEPYYLYRQKNIAGNFENVGYAKVDKAGIYNILIMEELQSIVAVGAGASTKIVHSEEHMKLHGSQRIERIENVKDVSRYIERIDEMIERKGERLWH